MAEEEEAPLPPPPPPGGGGGDGGGDGGGGGGGDGGQLRPKLKKITTRNKLATNEPQSGGKRTHQFRLIALTRSN